MPGNVEERAGSMVSGWVSLPILLVFGLWLLWVIVAAMTTPGAELGAIGILLSAR